MTYRSYLLKELKDRDKWSGNGMNQVLPGLYIGNIHDSKDVKQLDMNKITHILAIHDDAKKSFKDKRYLLISAADSPRQDLTQYFSQCNDFIHAARLRGGHVLVHCLAGMSRSVTLTAAYIISITNLNHQEALHVIRGTRTVANPNQGFQKQLCEFEQSCGLYKERKRLKNKFKPRLAILKPSSQTSTASPGRLTVRTVTVSSPEEDNLAVNDERICVELIENYKNLVNRGDLCAGNCDEVKKICSTGVCRTLERPLSAGFFRKGTISTSCSSSPAKNIPFSIQNGHFQHPHLKSRQTNWNLWSIERDEQLRFWQQIQMSDPPSEKIVSTHRNPTHLGQKSFAQNSRFHRSDPSLQVLQTGLTNGQLTPADKSGGDTGMHKPGSMIRAKKFSHFGPSSSVSLNSSPVHHVGTKGHDERLREHSMSFSEELDFVYTDKIARTQHMRGRSQLQLLANPKLA